MSNDRAKRGKGDSGRDAGGFVALPWSVLDSPAYKALSYPARALLLEIARQFVRDNNGRLLASRAYLAKRGWTSASVIDRAKRELIAAGLIFETVKGHRPNKASWYAVTWRTLDRHADYEPGAVAAFERGAYRTLEIAPTRPTREQCFERWRHAGSENTAPSPAGGTEPPAIAPAGGTGKAPPVPAGGPIKATLRASPVPSPEHHLEKPSAVAPATSEQDRGGIDEVETVRVRDQDLDPSLYDPATGEHLRPRPKPALQQRAGAQAWVTAALQGRARRA